MWVWLATRWWAWAILVVLLLVGGVWAYADLKARWDPTYQEAQQKLKVADEMIKQADAALKDVAAKDQAIAALSQEIEKRKKAADVAIADARAARQREQQWIAETQRLMTKITQIERERAALKPVTTLQEAQRELQTFGYHPLLYPAARP